MAVNNSTWLEYINYSASNGATGAWLFTCTPPRFFSLLSQNGSFHPPSLSGVASHRRIRCRRGVGGAWSL